MIKEDIRISDELILGSLRKKDLSHMAGLLNEKKIHDNTLSIPFPYKLKDAVYFYNLVDQWEKVNGIKRDWHIRLNDVLIGGVGLMYDDGKDSHKSQLGYWIGAPYRGKGVMATTLKVFLNYIFESRPGLLRLEAHVFPENISSQKTLEKTGFIREGYFRQYCVKNGEMKDAIQYAIFNPTTS